MSDVTFQVGGRWKQTRGSKMRNKPVWECPGCGSTSAPCHTPKKRAKCLSCGQTMIYHQSQKEFKRWKELQQLEKAGQIRGLERQKPFTFTPMEDIEIFAGQFWATLKAGEQLVTKQRRPFKYVADFVYQEKRFTGYPAYDDDWQQVTEDVKGRRKGAAYELFWLKRELMRLVHGIEIREI